mgnify:CR=1 FL=1
MSHTPQLLTFAICTDIHQDIMHDGPQRLTSFVEAAAEAQVDMAIQLGDFCQPTEANRDFLAIWEERLKFDEKYNADQPRVVEGSRRIVTLFRYADESTDVIA